MKTCEDSVLEKAILLAGEPPMNSEPMPFPKRMPRHKRLQLGPLVDGGVITKDMVEKCDIPGCDEVVEF